MSDVISVLCPTRARPGLAACTIRMLLSLAAKPARIEVILRVDDDERVDYREVWKGFAPRGAPPVRGRLMVGPRCGYAGLNMYLNEMAKAATGRWCMLWNDDIFMATPKWDLILDGVPGEVAVALTESNHGRSPCTFPFFTKTYSDIIGHVSAQTHNDTWIEEVGKAAGITVDVPILVLHAMMDDALAKEGKADGRIEKTSAEYYSPPMQAQRAEDVRKIREYLTRKK